MAPSVLPSASSGFVANPTSLTPDLLIQQGLGCDFSGTVIEGEGANVKKGDRVAGFVHGGNSQAHGAFAEHVKTKADLVWKVPSNVSAEEAAALGGIGPGE